MEHSKGEQRGRVGFLFEDIDASEQQPSLSGTNWVEVIIILCMGFLLTQCM